MHQGILSWSTCRWHECRSACWRISGFSSCPSPSRTPAPAAPSSCPACRRSRTRSAPARPRRRHCSCRPSSWAGAEVGCTHREAADTGQSRMLLSYVPVFTGIPLLLTKWDMPGELRLLGHKKENEIMQLSSSFFLFFSCNFFSCNFVPAGHNAVTKKAGLSVKKFLCPKHMYQGVNKGWICILKQRRGQREPSVRNVSGLAHLKRRA